MLEKVSITIFDYIIEGHIWLYYTAKPTMIIPVIVPDIS